MREVEEELIFNENIFLSLVGFSFLNSHSFTLVCELETIVNLYRRKPIDEHWLNIACHQADLCLRDTLIFAYGTDFAQKVV